MEDIQNFFTSVNSYYKTWIQNHPAMKPKSSKADMKDLETKLNNFKVNHKYKSIIDTLQALSYTNLNETVNFLIKLDIAGICMLINGHALANLCNVEDLLFIGKRDDGTFFVEKNKSKKKACKSKRPRMFTIFPKTFVKDTRVGTLSSNSSTSTTSLEEMLLEWTKN